MKLRQRLVWKTTLELINKIVTGNFVIVKKSKSYVSLLCKYLCLADYSFQHTCYLPGYVRTFVCFLKFFFFFFKVVVTYIYQTFGFCSTFFFFKLINTTLNWEHYLQCVLGSDCSSSTMFAWMKVGSAFCSCICNKTPFM